MSDQGTLQAAQRLLGTLAGARTALVHLAASHLPARSLMRVQVTGASDVAGLDAVHDAVHRRLEMYRRAVAGGELDAHRAVPFMRPSWHPAPLPAPEPRHSDPVVPQKQARPTSFAPPPVAPPSVGAEPAPTPRAAPVQARPVEGPEPIETIAARPVEPPEPVETIAAAPFDLATTVETIPDRPAQARPVVPPKPVDAVAARPPVQAPPVALADAIPDLVDPVPLASLLDKPASPQRDDVTSEPTGSGEIAAVFAAAAAAPRTPRPQAVEPPPTEAPRPAPAEFSDLAAALSAPGTPATRRGWRPPSATTAAADTGNGDVASALAGELRTPMPSLPDLERTGDSTGDNARGRLRAPLRPEISLPDPGGRGRPSQPRVVAVGPSLGEAEEVESQDAPPEEDTGGAQAPAAPEAGSGASLDLRAKSRVPQIKIAGHEEVMEAGAVDDAEEDDAAPGAEMRVSFERGAPAETRAPRLTDDRDDEGQTTPGTLVPDAAPVVDEARIVVILQEAVQHARKGDLQRAIQSYTDALHMNHAMVEAFIGRGRCYLEVGDYSSAMSDFQRAEDLQPDKPDPHVAMGDLYFARKEYKRAIEFYDQAVELDGSHAMARCRRGISHYYRKNYRQAFQDLQRALVLDPEIPNIRKYVQMAQKKLEKGE